MRCRQRSRSRPDQIAHGFVRRIRHPRRREFLRPQQLGQHQAIAPVRLHPHTRAARRHGRRNHLAGHAGLAAQPPIDPIAAGTCLVTHHQPTAIPPQLLDHPIERRSLVGDLAKVAHLAAGQRPGHADIDALLVCIQSDVECILCHERSPMLEARRRPIRRNPCCRMRRDRSLRLSADMWTEEPRLRAPLFEFVMPGLVPGIHVFVPPRKTWMAGHRRAEATPFFERLCPAMTNGAEATRRIQPLRQAINTVDRRPRRP